jgi:hypothetical protein
VPPNELLELMDHRFMSAYGEIGFDPFLERREVQLFEAADLLLSERVVGELGKRRATPKRERIPQRLGSLVGIIGGECRAAIVEQSSKAIAVQLAGLDAEQIAMPAS